MNWFVSSRITAILVIVVAAVVVSFAGAGATTHWFGLAGDGLSSASSDDNNYVDSGYDSDNSTGDDTTGDGNCDELCAATNAIRADNAAPSDARAVKVLGSTDGWLGVSVETSDGNNAEAILTSISGDLTLVDIGSGFAVDTMSSQGVPVAIQAAILDTSISDVLNQLPSEPNCPEGWTKVAWATWTGGRTIVCASTSGTYYMDYQDGDTELTSTKATHAGNGGYSASYTASFDSGPTVTISLGGSLVQNTSSGTTSSRIADVGWAQGFKTEMAGTDSDAAIPACPDGSYPLSLSTWDGGWLLTCGIDESAPSSFAYSTGGSVTDGGSMSSSGDGFCGKDDSGNSVCAYPSPSLVTVTPPDGDATQYSAASNYFATRGSGGSGQGNGAYGVDAPKDTADDQVRYLQQILDKSAEARAALDPALTSCDIPTLQSVADNRTELLDALASTPVDKIPNGDQLYSELKDSLDYSLTADNEYIDWAKAGCHGDIPRPNADALAAAKRQFTDDWNSSIVGSYSAATSLTVMQL